MQLILFKNWLILYLEDFEFIGIILSLSLNQWFNEIKSKLSKKCFLSTKITAQFTYILEYNVDLTTYVGHFKISMRYKTKKSKGGFKYC